VLFERRLGITSGERRTGQRDAAESFGGSCDHRRAAAGRLTTAEQFGAVDDVAR
jgi:hypothetical protein